MRKQKLNIIRNIYTLFVLLLAPITVALAQNESINRTDTLAEKVNIAYGEQSKLSIASAMSTVNADQLQKRPSLSTSEALIGRLPGVTVRQTSTEPGSAPQIYVRGRNTYNTDMTLGKAGNAPLVMIDGFKADLNQISLYEIENISVLKDAAALAIYGMDGANGAILVTTKRGKAGKTVVGIEVNSGIMQPTQLPDYLNAHNYAVLYNEALRNDGKPAMYKAETISKYGQGGAHQYLAPDNDYWRDLTNKIAPYTTAAVNVSGGSNAVRYMVNVGYVHNGGLFKNTEQSDKYSSQLREDRFNIRTNLDAQVTKNFSTMVSVSALLGKSNAPGAGSTINDIIHHFGATPPQAFPYINPDGTYGGTATYANNPLALIESTGYKKILNRNINGTLRLKYDFSSLVKGLSASAAFNIDANTMITDAKTKSYATYAITGYDKQTGAYSYSPMQGINNDLTWNGAPTATDQRYTMHVDIRYDRSFGKHDVNGLLLLSNEQSFIYNDYYVVKSVGAAFRGRYGYDNRFFADLTASYNGGDQFAPGNKFGFFPAAGAAWVISNEKFMKNATTVDFLKVRASYGVVGGADFATNTSPLFNSRIFFEKTYTTGQNVYFGNQTSGGVMSSTQMGIMANPSLTWEKSHKFDFGVDMSLWKRVDLAVDLFHDRRTDIITLDRYMPAIVGSNLGGRQPRGNGGEVKNWGYEIMAGIHGGKHDFHYSVDAGIWYNKNEIIKHPAALSYTNPEASVIGGAVNQNMGFLSNGFFPVGTPVGASSNPFQSFGVVGPGDVRYIDRTGDGVVDDNDRIAMGYSDLPEYTYSIAFEVGYKGFYLSAMGQGTMNSSMMMSGMMIPFSTNGNAYNYAKERWTPETASTAKYPRLSASLVDNNAKPSPIWQRSTAYFKIRDVELGYVLPQTASKKIGASNVKVFLRGNNLATFTKDLDFIDPEALSAGYPLMRMYSIGVSAKF